uniref:Uncharacterized protein n=1 Tax=Anguilla anguilla TaxID=7936 RepID=A0A0E9UTG3_ANGAN
MRGIPKQREQMLENLQTQSFGAASTKGMLVN